MNGKKSFKTSLIYAVASNDTVNGFKKLYGNRYANEKLLEYYSKKLRLSVIVLAAGFLGFLVYPYMKTHVLVKPYEVKRNAYGGGSKSVSLRYRLDNGDDKKLELTVNERKYTDEELEKLYAAFEDELEDTILGSNLSVEHVTEDLKFVSRIDKYPFTVSYKTDKPTIVSYSGKIDHSKSLDSEGELVNIITTVIYDDFKRELYVPVYVFDKELTAEEMIKKSFDDELKVSDESTEHSEYMRLPDTVEGHRVYYFEDDKNLRFVIIITSCIFAVMLFVGNNDELKKEIKKRDEQLTADYPVLINKFAIFYNAGIPINAIWNKLCDEYEEAGKEGGSRHYLYEEMLITRTMMKDGKNEIEAYEDFGKRCGLRQYKVFVSLLQQAITKGKENMGELLRQEAEDAFTAKKNDAKKLSEEASSKLLLPMFMMLVVVMVMIMFPAFRSFN